MREFNDINEALEFSEENDGTLVKCVQLRGTGSVYQTCYFYNGMFHGEYIRYNYGSIKYRDFNINDDEINVGSLTEIQLQSIFGECYGNIQETNLY